MRKKGGRFSAAIAIGLVAGSISLGYANPGAHALGPITVTPISTDHINADPTSQHQTEVEPTTAAWGNTIVSTFQVGRFATNGSGASATGWATSTNGGQTWTDGILGGINTTTTPAGPYPRSVNMTVAYDSVHAQWMIVTLGELFVGSIYTEIEMLVSRSEERRVGKEC